jgi:hypothetical protein
MIDPNRVTELLKDCLFTDEETKHSNEDGVESYEIPANGVPVQGIMNRFIFNKDRLEQHRAEITDMLLQLPDDFMKSKGGGMSFLQACVDKNGEQWTGLHLVMDQLLTLGQAIGRAKCLFPREMWSIMPGGMPYYVIFDDAVAVSTAAG